MPPDNWWGYSLERLSGSGIPTFASISQAALAASSSLILLCILYTSAIWSPIVNTGFSAVIGSWNIMLALSPLMPCIWESVISCSSFPSNSNLSAPLHPGRSSSLMIERAVMLFPHPLSPTSATESPLLILMSTPVTTGM